MIAVLAAVAAAPGLAAPAPAAAPSTAALPAAFVQTAPRRVLVFSRTEGFRHDSIPAGIEALRAEATRRGWQADFTEDHRVFTPDRLATYDTVVFLLTTGDVLDEPEERAFEAFVREGGGYVGIHSASDTEYGWGWYGRLVGAYFASHPAVQPGTVRLERPDHPTQRHLPNPWRRTDEWYDFRTNPRGQVEVLANLDPRSYQGGRMPDDHPITWAHDRAGGRAWYTAMGHTQESYREPEFVRMLGEAMAWTMRRPKARPGAAAPGSGTEAETAASRDVGLPVGACAICPGHG